MGWQLFSVVQLIAGNTVINPDGIFTYNGAPGPGNNPVFAAVGPSVTTDPYGNPVTPVVSLGNAASSHISVDQFGEMIIWNSSGQLTMFLQPSKEAFLIYNPPAGAGELATSLAAVAGTDNFGNAILAGPSAYGSSFAASLNAGFLSLYSGSQAAGWTSQATLTLASGVLFLTAAAGINLADATVVGSTLEVQGVLTADSNVVVTGTLSVGGSTSTQGPSNNNTSTNGLTNGQIAGTSGAASAGTAHTHGPGSYAVTNGTHSHTLNSHTHVL